MTEALAQTVLQMGMTNYQPLRSYVVLTFPLRTLYRRYARQLGLRKFCYAFHTSAVYTVSQKNDNDIAHYNFNAH